MFRHETRRASSDKSIFSAIPMPASTGLIHDAPDAAR